MLCRMINGDQEFMQYLDQVKARLQAKGASEDVMAYVQDLLVQVRGQVKRAGCSTILTIRAGREQG